MKKSVSSVKLLIYVPLFLLPIIIYFSVTGHQFLTNWDDAWMVLNNYTIGGLSLANIGKIFSESNMRQYSPVNQLIYTIIYSLVGADPFSFHLASIIWHAINVCLVYAFVKSLLGLRESSENAKLIQITAFLTAMLFAVHPVNTEAVAWISASKVPLYTLFGLSALLCYLRYLKSGRKIPFTMSIMFFILSFGCKEQATILPLAVLLIDWFACRDFRDRKLWLEKIPFLAIVALGGLFTLSLRNHDYIQIYAGYPLWQRIVFACNAITEYLTKLIVPVKLMYVYPFPMVPGEPLPSRFLIYPLIFAAICYFIICFRKHTVLVFSALFFLMNVSLTLHLISMSRITIVADRYIYLSSIGFFMTVVWFCVKFFLQQSKNIKKILCVIFAAYSLYLSVYAVKRSEVWYDNKTLKKEVNELLKQREDFFRNNEVLDSPESD